MSQWGLQQPSGGHELDNLVPAALRVKRYWHQSGCTWTQCRRTLRYCALPALTAFSARLRVQDHVIRSEVRDYGGGQEGRKEGRITSKTSPRSETLAWKHDACLLIAHAVIQTVKMGSAWEWDGGGAKQVAAQGYDGRPFKCIGQHLAKCTFASQSFKAQYAHGVSGSPLTWQMLGFPFSDDVFSSTLKCAASTSANRLNSPQTALRYLYSFVGSTTCRNTRGSSCNSRQQQPHISLAGRVGA